MNTPSLEIIVVLGLAVLALLFFGYQLDDMHRRVKELESLEEHEIKHIARDINRNLDSSFRESEQKTHNILVVLSDRIGVLEEKLKQKPKGKRGRPRKVNNEMDINKR